MKIQNLLFVLLLVIGVSCKTEKANEPEKNVTVLRGELVGRDSKKIMLFKGDANEYKEKPIDTIFVENNNFRYELKMDTLQAYKFVFYDELYDKNAMGYTMIDFFPDADTVTFKLHHQDNRYKNSIKGGELNLIYSKYLSAILQPVENFQIKISEELTENYTRSIQSDEYNALIKKIDNGNLSKDEFINAQIKLQELIKNNNHLNDLGIILTKKIDSSFFNMVDSKYALINDNLSIATYYLLLEDLETYNYTKVPYNNIHDALLKHKEKFPDHPYTQRAVNLFDAITKIRKGEQYINITAPDINGKQYELKDILSKNEIVLLDLWATWCGPCIYKTRQVLPVYEQYKDKGFAILGIAGEYKSLDAYKSFMKKNKWEWLNLIELDRENKIWEKYGVANAGGAMFLIDKSGEILAANPDEKEVAAILKERL